MPNGLSARCALAQWVDSKQETRVARVSIANESDQVNEGHSVDALAVRGYEGRGTLR